MIIGPYTPPFSLISQTDTLEVFAEIGVILLLFVVGMEFPIAKLKQVGGKPPSLPLRSRRHISRRVWGGPIVGIFIL